MPEKIEIRNVGGGAPPMPWAEKDMILVLKESDEARISPPRGGHIRPFFPPAQSL